MMASVHTDDDPESKGRLESRLLGGNARTIVLWVLGLITDIASVVCTVGSS